MTEKDFMIDKSVDKAQAFLQIGPALRASFAVPEINA
jgi:hypothetical protein